MDSNKLEVLSLLKELIRFANSDGEYREMEHEFLLAISQQLGVSQQDFNLLFEANIDFTPPKFEFERIIQFQRLLLLMHVDREISNSEIQSIKSFGMHLGLNPEAVNQVLDQSKNYENAIIPPEKLIEIFKIYHN